MGSGLPGTDLFHFDFFAMKSESLALLLNLSHNCFSWRQLVWVAGAGEGVVGATHFWRGQHQDDLRPEVAEVLGEACLAGGSTDCLCGDEGWRGGMCWGRQVGGRER